MTSWKDEERRVGRVLVTARRKLHNLNSKLPKGSDIVFEVIKEIMEIEKRLKVRTPSPRELRAQLIEYTHTQDERLEAAKQRRIDEADGDDPAVVWGIDLITTPDEMKTLDAVKSTFRLRMVGHNMIRDWKLLQKLGEGRPSRKIARQHRISMQRVLEIKGLQCAAIWMGVSYLAESETTGRIWSQAA